MSIIKILLSTIFRMLFCMVDGLTEIFEKTSEYIGKLCNKIDTMFEKKKKKEDNIDVPV